MSLSGPQRYSFDELREKIDNALLNEEMPDKLYKSVDGISRIINAIFTTKGGNWAAQVLDDNGKPLLTPEEQTKFTDVFNPYIDSIKNFFNGGNTEDYKREDDNEMTDGATIGGAAGIDEVYTKIIDRIKSVDNTVNNYASKFGILKLEKEHDLKPDIGLPIPQPLVLPPPLAPAIPILSSIRDYVKIPFRTIITIIYLILDITRLAMGSSGSNIGRKILSILVALLELLRGDWKKAILTGIGFYGMSPMLTGQLLKVFLTVFRTLSPDIQKNIVFAPLDIGKSLITGILLSIFQIAAPASIRTPLIAKLDEIAAKKAEIDITLESSGKSERPDYLSPNWNDLNNIQAVLSDKPYICSCQGRELIKTVNESFIIRNILQMLRIPTSEEMITQKCGSEVCKDFSTLMGTDSTTSSETAAVEQPATATAVKPATAAKLATAAVEQPATATAAKPATAATSGGNPHCKRKVRRAFHIK